MRHLGALLTLLACIPAWTVHAQAPSNTLGAVTKIDPAAKTLTLKTDAGQEIAVQMVPNVNLRKIAPGEKDLANAATIEVGAIAVGDRVLARGVNANQVVTATLIVVMSQGDIVKKQAAERADWDKRGVTGLVTGVSSDSVTLRSRTLAGTASIEVSAAPGAVVRRYEPDSIKFADAKPASLGDIKPGDQVRARGNKSADGTKLVAEEIVSGTFRTIAAVVVSANAEAGEIRVTDLETKKPMTVRVNKDSSLRKLPPQVAQAIAVRVRPDLAKTAAAKPAAQAPGAGGPSPSTPPSAPDLQQMIDKSPAVMLSELKAGDALVISSTVGAAADRITAITLIAGVEPILTKPGTTQMSLGSWSLDIGSVAQ